MNAKTIKKDFVEKYAERYNRLLVYLDNPEKYLSDSEGNIDEEEKKETEKELKELQEEMKKEWEWQLNFNSEEELPQFEEILEFISDLNF